MPIHGQSTSKCLRDDSNQTYKFCSGCVRSTCCIPGTIFWSIHRGIEAFIFIEALFTPKELLRNYYCINFADGKLEIRKILNNVFQETGILLNAPAQGTSLTTHHLRAVRGQVSQLSTLQHFLTKPV